MTLTQPLREALVGAVPCLAAVALLTTASPASAAPPSPNPAGTDYVALGSSFAAGPGIPDIIDPRCGRSDNNYAHLVAEALQLTLTDVTCSGATINNIVDTPQNGRSAQITAVTDATDVVTVTIGGNDVNYLADLYRNSCAVEGTTAVPGNDPAVPDPFDPFFCTQFDLAAAQEQLAGLTAELVDMVEAIQQAAPNARVVLVDYLTILPQNGKPCPGLPLDREEIRYSLDVARQLALATKHAAQRTGAELVELSKASRHHDVCSANPWVTGWEFGPDIFAGGVLAYHPSEEGMEAAAALVIDQLS
jgi:lysophospholipase L1-like esterase